MYNYPVLEQDGFRVSVSTQKLPTRRWRACLRFEPDRGHAVPDPVQASETVRVPNDYPSEALAVQAAYNHARELIGRAH
jgi:hypothetical protein